MTKGEFLKQIANMPTRDEILAVDQVMEICNITSRVNWNLLNHSISNKEIFLELSDISLNNLGNIVFFIVINMDLQGRKQIEKNEIDIKDFLEIDAFYVFEFLREVFEETLEYRCQISRMSFQELKKVVKAGIL